MHWIVSNGTKVVRSRLHYEEIYIAVVVLKKKKVISSLLHLPNNLGVSFTMTVDMHTLYVLN